jgi:hypothetical protein
MMFDEYWCDMTWLNVDVNVLHVKKIDLNGL